MTKFVGSTTALVTGAAGGIGYELSKLFASDGNNLVLVDMDQVGIARVAGELAKTYGIEVHTITKDLSDINAPLEICQEIDELGIDIDVLVNNAGYGLAGEFSEIDLEKQLNMIQVNVSAVVSLTGHLLPKLMKRENAAIMNVASIAAFAPGPYMSTYFASKAFVLSFSEGLSKELEGTNVSVTTLCPPPTATNFAARAGAKRTIAFKDKALMKVTDVARHAYEGMKEKRVVVLPGIAGKFIVLINRFVPRSVPRTFTAILNKGRSAPAEKAVRQTIETPLPLRQSS